MVRACIISTFSNYDDPSLRTWLKRDGPVARSAGSVLIIMPGTVFAAAWQAATAVWVAGGTVILKPSRREPAFAKLLAQSVRKITGSILPIAVQKSSTLPQKAHTIIAYGKDETIQNLRTAMKRPSRLIGFGSMISLACVGKQALAKSKFADMAQRIAWDVTLYDTQGCLSPQCVYIEEGGSVSPSQFARAIARAMRRLERRLPPKKVKDEAWPVESFWQRWRFLESQNRAQIHEDRVILHQESRFEPCGMRRVLFAIPWRRTSEIPRHLGDWHKRISTIATSDSITQTTLKRAFQKQPAIRWCKTGEMHQPPPWWRNGGVSLLRELR